MPNPIEFARNASRNAHKGCAGIYVRIKRNGVQGPLVLATLGYSKSFEQADGQILTFRQRDYIINVEDYKVGGVITAPARGDTIIEVVNGDENAYEVLPHNSETVASYTDSLQRYWRVHTKEGYYV